MGNLSELLGVPFATLGFGGIAGLVVGYASKKIAKIAALILGLLFIVLQVLVSQDLITVNWGAVEETTTALWTGADGVTLADRAWVVLTRSLPFAGAFGVGFVLGFKLG